MSQGITLRVTLPAAIMALVPDEGARDVSGWSFVRVRADRETWHLVGHLGDEPWVSSEVLAVDPKLDLVVARPGVAFMVGERVRFAKGATYKLTGYPADPTPAMLSVKQRAKVCGPPFSNYPPGIMPAALIT